MTAATVGLVLAAGAAGAVLRGRVVAALPRSGTLVVNLSGTAVLAVTAAAAGAGRLGPELAAVLGLGFAGALTTFSGWMAEISAGTAAAPVRTALRDVVTPLLAGVAIVVAAFVGVG